MSFEEQREIGKSYLEGLRKLNEGKIRKSREERSSSMMELTKKPVYPNYLQNIRSKEKVETSKRSTRWRKIMKNDQMNNRDKYNSVMEEV